MAGFREFLTGEVLTAANVNSFLMNQSVMVFADSAARDTALGTAIAGGNALVEGMLTYNVDASALQVYDGTEWTGVAPVAKEKRIEAFTGSGTWTVPAGVTYAIAHMLGGGGGAGRGSSGDGGTSSVGFAGGTVSGLGGKGQDLAVDLSAQVTTAAGQANSGRGAYYSAVQVVGARHATVGDAGSAQFIVAADAVTPAASITVTVGAGGTAGTSGSAGGTGYVYIEYYEEV